MGQEAVAAGTRHGARGTRYSDTYCVPRQQYRFEMRDTFNDGICCSNGEGSYSVTYDGTVRASGGEYQSLDASTCGSCSSVVPPGPTKDPTLPPVPPPTDVPTRQPSFPPIRLPPTPLLTKGPTSPPTSSPTTKEPTSLPISPPTGLPAKRPTTPPTNASTAIARLRQLR